VIVHESREETLALGEFLRRRPPSRVVVETCAEAFRVADAALEAGHQVRVVPATLARALGVGARRTKTDRRDAAALSEVSAKVDLQSVHIPSQQSREQKAICGMRDALVSARTAVINNLKGWLRAQGIRIASGSSDTLPARVREVEELPDYVESQLIVLDALNCQIAEHDERIEAMAKSSQICQRLMTVPGVGPHTAVRFVATIDDLSRFKSAHKLESYFGLVPGEYSSSDKKRRLGITKAGSPQMRCLLVQAAWAARRARKRTAARSLQLWSAEIEKRRGKRIAVVALARKLAGILYALWRDGTTYQGT
jgi:transposase